MAYRYRDSKTGHFAKESTWKRGKTIGSKRYKREPIKRIRKRGGGILPPIPPIPPGKHLWRVTVSAPYFYREGKSRGSLSSSYMVRGWYSTRNAANLAATELEQRAIDGRFDALEKNSKAWWNGPDTLTNIEIRQVSYDKRLLDIIEEKNENLDD